MLFVPISLNIGWVTFIISTILRAPCLSSQLAFSAFVHLSGKIPFHRTKAIQIFGSILCSRSTGKFQTYVPTFRECFSVQICSFISTRCDNRWLSSKFCTFLASQSEFNWIGLFIDYRIRSGHRPTIVSISLGLGPDLGTVSTASTASTSTSRSPPTSTATDASWRHLLACCCRRCRFLFVLSQLRDSPESLNLSLGLSRVYTLSPA